MAPVSHKRRWLPAAFAVAGAVCIVSAACAGGGEEANVPSPSPPPPEPQLTPARGPADTAARDYLRQLASVAPVSLDAMWDMTSSEIKEVCPRELFDRSIAQFRFRIDVDSEGYQALAQGAAHLSQVAQGEDWVLIQVQDAGLTLALVREGEAWRVHPDLSTTYCSQAPPLPAIVEMAGVLLTPMPE